jgi:hypothetical protein
MPVLARRSTVQDQRSKPNGLSSTVQARRPRPDVPGPMFHVEHRAEFDCATQRAVDPSEFDRPGRYASGCSRGRLALMTKISGAERHRRIDRTRVRSRNPALIPVQSPARRVLSDSMRPTAGHRDRGVGSCTATYSHDAMFHVEQSAIGYQPSPTFHVEQTRSARIERFSTRKCASKLSR